MQKSELKTQTLKNSLKQGDLNIIIKTDCLKKNIEKSNILYHLVTCKSSKCYSTEPNSDSDFFGKKYKKWDILSYFVTQKSLQRTWRVQSILKSFVPYSQKANRKGITATQKPQISSKNETLFQNKIRNQPKLNIINQFRGFGLSPFQLINI
jgi:hypothetical protein